VKRSGLPGGGPATSREEAQPRAGCAAHPGKTGWPHGARAVRIGLVSSAVRSALVNGLALTTMASLASAIAGPFPAAAPAVATPRLSRSSCRGSARRRSGRPATPSRPASAAWRWVGADVDDAVDERSRVSASRYALVHMAAVAGRLSAVPECGPGCPRDRGRRSRECRTAARSAPGRPRRRWPAAARRCRRDPWWPGGSSRRCPWPSSR
jgi:hypothetical protein